MVNHCGNWRWFHDRSVGFRKEDHELIVEGICLVKSKSEGENDSLGLNEIDDTRHYTVAFPYRCINGQRLGLVLNDYEIIGQGYLFSLLNEYFKNPQNHNLDQQLGQIKLNIL